MSSTARGEGPRPRDGVPPPPCPPPPTSDGNTAEPLRRTVRVINPIGLHLRAADRFSRAAKQYTCSVVVCNGDRRANGKSLWDLVELAVMPETEVVVEVDGADAAAALDALAEILGAPTGEDYAI
jgi:phosphocarrier protein HPr